MLTSGNIAVSADPAPAWTWLRPRYAALAGPVPPSRPIGGGFSGAAVWRVEADTPLAVRRWPPDGIAADRLRGLHRLLDHVRSEGVDFVAAPIPADDGRTFVSDGAAFWQVEPWLPGAACPPGPPTSARLCSAMRALAQWHRAAARFEPAQSERAWFHQAFSSPSPTISRRCRLIEEWLSGRAAVLLETARGASTTSSAKPRADIAGATRSTAPPSLWLPPDAALANANRPASAPGPASRADPEAASPRHASEEADRADDDATAEWTSRVLADFLATAPIVLAELRTFEPRAFRLQPVLRDVWRDHLLFTGDTVTGLIDPSAARADSVAVDLARLLGSLLEDDRARWNEALDEYARAAPLTETERTLARVLDRSAVLLNPLTWLERLAGGTGPRTRPDVLLRLRAQAGRLAHLRREHDGLCP